MAEHGNPPTEPHDSAEAGDTEPKDNASARPASGHGNPAHASVRWLSSWQTRLIIAGMTLVGLIVLRAGGNLAWGTLIIIGVGVIGGLMWLPAISDGGSRAEFGTALATGAFIAGVIFQLTLNDQNDAAKMAKHDQQVEQAIATRQTLTLELTLQHNLAGIDLSNDTLNHLDLGYKLFTNAMLYNIQFTHGRFRYSNLNGASLIRANLSHTGMFAASLRRATLSGATLDYVNFDQADLTDANLGTFFLPPNQPRTTSLGHANFEDATLRGACLAGSDARYTTYEGADLANADFDYSNLRGAQFIVDGEGAYVRGATFYGARLDAGTRRFLTANGASVVPPTAPNLRGTSIVISHGTVVRRGVVVGHTEGDHAEGDTVEISGLGWTRMIGANAPNDLSPATSEAINLVDRLLPIGAAVRYELGRRSHELKPGKASRALAYLWTSSGVFVNQALLLEGLGLRETDQGEGSLYGHALDAAARYARAAGNGVWSYCPDSVGNDSVPFK
jgi:uncharacterized protein YjbI with pentapeptide repeats